MDDSSVESLIPLIFVVVLIVIPVWKILQKAGLNPAISLFIFLPGVGPLIVTLILAFADWPATKPNLEKE